MPAPENVSAVDVVTVLERRLTEEIRRSAVLEVQLEHAAGQVDALQAALAQKETP